MQTPERPKVSVVINTYNRCAHLSNALRSLEHVDYADFEVVVVNGPSTDGTDDFLRSLEGRIKSVRCPAENLSMSRNLGIEASAGEIVAFMDDDAVAHPGWLTNAIPLFEDPRVAAVGGYTIDNTGVRFQCMKPFCDRYGNSYFPSPAIDERAFCFPGSPVYPSLLGTNSMFRKSHLEEVGGFDDAYAYLLDETDVCLRLIERGHQIRFEPKALIYHQFAESHLRDPRRIPRNHYAPAASRAYFIMRFGFAANPEKALAELQRYKTDIAWSDRWFLDHKIIDNSAYFALRQGFEWGIAEGMRKAQTRASALGHLNRQAKPQPFLKFGAARKAITICFVSQGYPPSNNAGIAQWTQSTARSLADLGHAVHVVTRSPDGEEAMRFEDGVWVHECAPKDEQTELIAARYDLPPNIAEWCARVDRELTKIKSFGLDVVSFPVWDVEAMTCLDRRDFATVLTLHTTYRLARPFKPEWTERPIYGAYMVDRVIRAESECLKRAAFIHANSRAIVKDIEQAYDLDIADKSDVIYRGTKDLGPGRTKPKPKSGGPLEALYVGRFEPRKGFDILVGAIAAALRMNSNVRFALVGDAMTAAEAALAGEDGMIAALKHDRVEVRGAVAREELEDAYRNADVVIMPSRYESFGLVAIEAFSAGAPVICLRAAALEEIVDHRANGYLIDPEGDPAQAIAAALHELARDRNLLSSMSEQARRSFSDRFTQKIEAARIEALLSKAVGLAEAKHV